MALAFIATNRARPSGRGAPGSSFSMDTQAPRPHRAPRGMALIAIPCCPVHTDGAGRIGLVPTQTVSPDAPGHGDMPFGPKPAWVVKWYQMSDQRRAGAVSVLQPSEVLGKRVSAQQVSSPSKVDLD